MDPEQVGRVAIIEPRCWGLEHVAFNATLIATALEAYPLGYVDVYGEAGHIDGLVELFAVTRRARSSRVVWHPIAVPPRKARGWRRAAASRRLFAGLDRAFRISPPSAIVIATLDPLVLALLKARLFSTWAGLPAVAVFHELLAVLGRRSSRRWGLLASIVAPHPQMLTYVVLAESIRACLQRVAPRMMRRVLAVDHPSLLGDLPMDDPPPLPPALRFGFVGGGREAKGFVEFLEIAAGIRRENPTVSFEIVGSAPAQIPRKALAELTWSDQKLPFDEFARRLRNLSHVVWLGAPKHYELVASGSLADTLALGIPVICRSGPYVDHLFRRFGDIGEKCETLADVRDAILALVTNFSEDRYRRQRERLCAVRAALAPEGWALQLRQALSRKTADSGPL